MANSRRIVEAHYTQSDLGERVLAALAGLGKQLDRLTPEDLAAVDEFHPGQRAATVILARTLGLASGEHVLDVGCGLGGPSRFLAREHGCRVTGLDLTAEFCRAAAMLARRTGLDQQVAYHQGDALDMPYRDMTFDVVWAQCVSMNIADRDRLYAEMHRVLKPRGRLGLQEVVRGSEGEPHYPAPWARQPSESFLLPAAATRAKLERAGFSVISWDDVALAALAASPPAAGSTPLGLHLVLGPDFSLMARNTRRSLAERSIGWSAASCNAPTSR